MSAEGVVFRPTERVLVSIVLAVGLFDAILYSFLEVDVDVRSFSASGLIIAALMAAGIVYRKFRVNGERIAATLIGAALLIAFSNVGSVANYLLLGVMGEPIDQLLVGFDASLGLNWPMAMEAMTNYPAVSALLAVAYNASLLLVILVLLALGFSGHYRALHEFILALFVTAIFTIGFWAFFPSFGTTAVYTIPAEIQDLVRPVVGNEYGESLRSLGRNSIPEISPLNIQGIVAFPSYHTIMALACIFYGWSLPVFRYFFLVANIMVVASVPIHGGHHFVDVLGAFVVMAVVVFSIGRFGWASDIEYSDREYRER